MDTSKMCIRDRNYTALPPVHAELGRLADGGQAAGAPLSPKPSEGLSGSGGVQAARCV